MTDNEYVWVVRGHDQYENASYTESVWTSEEAALTHARARSVHASDCRCLYCTRLSGQPDVPWPYEIDRVRLNSDDTY